MRISTRLLMNAVTTYGRLGTTFLVGIFFVWYVLGEVGLVGFGALSLGAGSFGIAATLNYTIRQSVVRELSAAMATGNPARIERTVTSALAFTTLGAGVVLLIVGGLALLALGGQFRTDSIAGMPGVLAALFAVEGLITAAELVCAPFTLGFFASQRVGVDNAILTVKRFVSPVAAVLAFSVIAPDGPLAERLLVFAGVRGGLGVLEVVGSAVVARLVVPHLRVRRAAFDRGEFRAVAGTSWHTVQYTLAADLNPQLIMLVINLLFGLTFNGMWQIVIQVGGHARQLAKSGLHGIDPMAAHLQAEGRRESILHLMVRTVRYQLVQVLPFVMTYAVFLGPILTLWVSGRLARDEHLADVGIDPATAIGMITVMGAINLAAELFRASTFGLERMLYGMGLVRTYAWFAKWSIGLTVVGATALMWWFDTPVVAAIPLAVVQFIYFCILVPRAAARHADLSLGAVLRQALPRPILLTALLAVPVAGLRVVLPPLSVVDLLLLGIVTGGVFALLLITVGMNHDERARLREMLGRLRGVSRLERET
jgi:hypothetical protein